MRLFSLSFRVISSRKKINLVGTGGFEPPTPRTPSVCATRLRHVPTEEYYTKNQQNHKKVVHHNLADLEAHFLEINLAFFPTVKPLHPSGVSPSSVRHLSPLGVSLCLLWCQTGPGNLLLGKRLLHSPAVRINRKIK